MASFVLDFMRALIIIREIKLGSHNFKEVFVRTVANSFVEIWPSDVIVTNEF